MNNPRSEVLKACHLLLKSGLIARTWGNVSHRVDDTHFIITPSGQSYEGMVESDLVQVSIDDESYSSDQKPSGEKSVHATIYRHYPNAKAIIHTHQFHASSLSALAVESVKLRDGKSVAIAKYSLPSTKGLSRNIANRLLESGDRRVIMKHHGALLFGESIDELFDEAFALEEDCQSYGINMYKTSQMKDTHPQYATVFHDTTSSSYGEYQIVTNTAEDSFFKSIFIAGYTRSSFAVANTKELLALAETGTSMKAMVDDFAQLIAYSVEVVDAEGQRVAKYLNSGKCVLVKGVGLMYNCDDQQDFEAISMVASKNARAYLLAELHGQVKAIPRFDAWLMRLVYKKKYSKIASEVK